MLIYQQSTAQKLDHARETASQLVDTKTEMSAPLSGIKISELVRLLDFGSPDSSYCSARDQARGGRQHIESLAVIFSGSQNKGVSYCSEDHNPFRTESGGHKSGKGFARPVVCLKDDWTNHFPSMATLEAYTTIPSYLFVRGFLKKRKGYRLKLQHLLHTLPLQKHLRLNQRLQQTLTVVTDQRFNILATP